jgi:hypothetical protein
MDFGIRHSILEGQTNEAHERELGHGSGIRSDRPIARVERLQDQHLGRVAKVVEIRRRGSESMVSGSGGEIKVGG